MSTLVKGPLLSQQTQAVFEMIIVVMFSSCRLVCKRRLIAASLRLLAIIRLGIVVNQMPETDA